MGEAGAAHTIDAAGLIVAPGFIDIHSHSDMSLFDDPGGDSKAYQGVTTEVVGNCSFSPFPIRPDGKADFGMGSMDWPVEWKWRDLDGWATALESRGISLNVAPQVGQAALQIAVGATQDRPVTPDEMSAMQRLASEAIEQGAFSISTGLSLSPSEYMSTDEVIELCKAISHYEGVFYGTPARQIMAIEEAVDMVSGRGCRSSTRIWPYCRSPEGSPRAGAGTDLRLEVTYEAIGLDITYDSHPYNAAGAGIEQLVPTWAQAGGTDGYMARLRDPDTRKRIREEVASGFGHVPPRFDTWVISDVQSDANQDVVGRSIAEIAAERGIEAAEAVLQLEEEERGAVSAVVHGRVERDTRYFLSHPIGMVSSDGNAISPTGVHAHKQVHPRFYGTYPRILGRNVREQSLMSLEAAIEKMTSMPADRLKLKDRGRVGVGLFADLVAFDPGAIIDRSTFEKPHQLSEGVLHLLVRGEAVISGGRQTQARPARVLRRGHADN